MAIVVQTSFCMSVHVNTILNALGSTHKHIAQYGNPPKPTIIRLVTLDNNIWPNKSQMTLLC